ncbi:MAG: hypothetical protein ACNA75_05165 [Thiohalomonadaceae bacterium]
MKTIHIAAASLFALSLLPAAAFAHGGKHTNQVITTTTTTTYYSQAVHPRQAALQHAQGRGHGPNKNQYKHQHKYQKYQHQHRHQPHQPTQVIHQPARVEPSLQIRIGYRIDL